jgi:hypothetical protein
MAVPRYKLTRNVLQFNKLYKESFLSCMISTLYCLAFKLLSFLRLNSLFSLYKGQDS